MKKKKKKKKIESIIKKEVFNLLPNWIRKKFKEKNEANIGSFNIEGWNKARTILLNKTVLF